jgi:hypothetical protein
MKTLLFFSFVFISVAQKPCSRQTEPALPSCIQARIESIKQQPKWNPPAEVTEYRYNGKRVFLFSSNCCDQFSEVVDEACTYLCAPSGGITGKGDGKCPDFDEKAELVKVVWKDERN